MAFTIDIVNIACTINTDEGVHKMHTAPDTAYMRCLTKAMGTCPAALTWCLKSHPIIKCLQAYASVKSALQLRNTY